ncbi:hypothetical protein [Streptomyces abikoensis]|uniref:hypothetical protein n=1 Tax=Streptomyces abikoensis TaxID=97398 RepID=UPI00368EB907
MTEAIGLGRPITALPHWNTAQDQHPAVPGSLATLRAAGVHVLLGNGGFTPHPPRKGDLDAYG